MATWKAAADDPEAGASDCSSASGGPCGFLARFQQSAIFRHKMINLWNPGRAVDPRWSKFERINENQAD